MKIVIIHNAYPQYGGEDTVVANETAMLKRHGWNVIPWIVPTQESNWLNLVRCGLSAAWNPFAYLKLKALLKREKPDIVHCHNTFPLLSPAVFSACRSAGVPIVQTIHNYRHICPAGGFFRDGGICEECIGKKFPYPALIHKCYRNSRIASAIPAMTAYIQRLCRSFEKDVDALIALNGFMKGKLVEGGIPVDKIKIKPNFCPEPPDSNPERKLTPHAATFCYTGRLSVDKGIPLLLETWRRFAVSPAFTHPQSTQAPCLKIAGEGELAERVAEMSRQCSSIKYLGPLSHELTLELMAQSDALVCPSIWYEGMPMTLLEAFSTATPVIASQIGAIPEMVQHGVNGLLFPPGDTERLEECFVQLCAAPDSMQEMGADARKLYEKHYTEEANYPLLEAIYEQVIYGRKQ